MLGTFANNLDAEIKNATIEAAPPLVAEPVESVEDAPAVETSEYPVQSDPTIANAGLTEIDEPSATDMTNGHESHEAQGIPQNSSFGEGGNAAAEANWDNANDLATSQEWVEVPRDTVETDTGVTATPAAPSNVQSWADDQPDPVEVRTLVSYVCQVFTFIFDNLFLLRLFRWLTNSKPLQTTPAPPTNPNDGFHEVQRSRGGNRGDGQQRGRGGRGGDRGRGGYRGDYRGGRGRGGPRGGARGDRGGPRRSEES